MSMETSMIYGFGFKTNKVKDKTLLNFVKDNMHRLSDTSRINFQEMLDELVRHKMNFDTDDVIHEASKLLQNLDEMETDHIDDDFLYDLRNTLLNCVAEVMHNEDKIWFEYQPGQDGMLGEGGAIMLSACLPWNLSSAEKKLTEKDFVAICEKYTKLLGIPDEPVEDITVEYFG